MKLFAPLVALALPTVAPAVCPTAEDLDTGILFRTLDGDTELFRRVSENVVLSTYTSGSEESRILLQDLSSAHDFEISGHWLEVYGRCLRCVRARAATS